jgi:hypothetical protein
MKLLLKAPQEWGKFTLYFLGFVPEGFVLPTDEKALQGVFHEWT